MTTRNSGGGWNRLHYMMSVFIKILLGQAKWDHNLWQGWSTIKKIVKIFSLHDEIKCQVKVNTVDGDSVLPDLNLFNLIVHNSIVFETTLDPGMLASYDY